MEVLVPSLLNIVAALFCFCLAVTVLVRNWRRVTHQAFALLSFNLMFWALGVFAVIQSPSEAHVRFWVHFPEFVVCFLPATFYHFVGYFPGGQFDGSRRYLSFLYISGLIFAVNSLAPWYIGEITMKPGEPPLVAHHPTLLLVIASILVTLMVMHMNLRRKLRETHGFGRRQTQFVMSGIYAVFALGLLVAVLEPVFNTLRFQAYGPLATIALTGVFGYGMIRYHLLDTREFLARLGIYIGATTFIIATFIGFMLAVQFFTGGVHNSMQVIPAVLTALLVSLVFQTVRTRVEYFIEVTLLRRKYDIHKLYTRIAETAAETMKLDRLLESVAHDIQETIGVRIIRVLVIDDHDPRLLVSEFTSVEGERPLRTRDHGALIDLLREFPVPLLLEKILHRRPEERMVVVARQLAELDAYLCLPLRTSQGLVGILTLGQKDTHDIYSEEEVMAFRALIGPLGTAIGNARLYKRLEQLNTHLRNVLRNMREGVIAVNMNGIVTTVNEAAVRIAGRAKVGMPLEELTPEVAELLDRTLKTRQDTSDFETDIQQPGGHTVPVLMSASSLRVPGEVRSGAVALLYDLTQIKGLERNVQRADRLSSIGTLAAGMAHEIKNPLVSIKTFTQLLAERYEDSEFRATFEDVVPHEVDRIDTIVSRLLDFARPRPVRFQPQNIRLIVEKVLALLENQIRKNNLTVDTLFPEEDLAVIGDDQQLHQVLLNLMLNAIHAMEDRGEGLLHVRIEPGSMPIRGYGVPDFAAQQCVRIVVSDTGQGIPRENMHELFTPFFTTKDEGSGLGLAVVHGIVTEHGGQIDVASKVGEGTTFVVSLPRAKSLYSTEPTTAEAERIGMAHDN